MQRLESGSSLCCWGADYVFLRRFGGLVAAPPLSFDFPAIVLS